jgi:hypothetical protein
VAPPVQEEAPLRQVVDLGPLLPLHREDPVAGRGEKITQLAGTMLQDLGKAPASKAGPAHEETPGLLVRIEDPVQRVGQDDGHRRLVQRRLEEQFALPQLAALLLEDLSHPVVEPDKISQLVVSVRSEPHAEVPILEAEDPVRQGLQSPAEGPEGPAHGEDGGRQSDPERHEVDEPQGKGGPRLAGKHDGGVQQETEGEDAGHPAGDGEPNPPRPRGPLPAGLGIRGPFLQPRASLRARDSFWCALTADASAPGGGDQERGRRSRMIPSRSIFR